MDSFDLVGAWLEEKRVVFHRYGSFMFIHNLMRPNNGGEFRPWLHVGEGLICFGPVGKRDDGSSIKLSDPKCFQVLEDWLNELEPYKFEYEW